MASGEEKQIQPEQETFKQRAKKFDDEFKALCEKYNCQVVVNPVFVSTNHGSFEISLQTSVGELPRRTE